MTQFEQLSSRIFCSAMSNWPMSNSGHHTMFKRCKAVPSGELNNNIVCSTVAKRLALSHRVVVVVVVVVVFVVVVAAVVKVVVVVVVVAIPTDLLSRS